MTYDNRALAVAVEQYLHWQRWGLTHHEMMTSVGGHFFAGMTGDDVVVELVAAWNGLER